MSDQNIKAIPTTYNGINFRSRLEAKWARFFDLMGWCYEYEPVDLGGYIPDFVITGCKIPIYVEVKPALTMNELHEMCEKARGLTLGKKLLCLGATIGYEDDELAYPGAIGSMVSRINVCDRDMLDMYSMWFGNGSSNSDDWDLDDPSAQHCILGYHEYAEVRKCDDPLCGRYAPVSLGYRKECPFCGNMFPETWEWKDHKESFLIAAAAWKEAGNFVQYHKTLKTRA